MKLPIMNRWCHNLCQYGLLWEETSQPGSRQRFFQSFYPSWRCQALNWFLMCFTNEPFSTTMRIYCVTECLSVSGSPSVLPFAPRITSKGRQRCTYKFRCLLNFVYGTPYISSQSYCSKVLMPLSSVVIICAMVKNKCGQLWYTATLSRSMNKCKFLL